MGAGDAGEIALREIRNNSSLGYLPVGFIDDNQEKVGKRIHGVQILGSRQDLPDLVQKHQIEEILVAIPSVDWRTLKSIYKDCKKTGAIVQVMSNTRKFAKLSTA